MAKKKANAKKIDRDTIISAYMIDVLENGHEPKSVFKFCKEHAFTETDFYDNFGSFENLGEEIWNTFYNNSVALIHKSKGYEAFSNQDKMLTLFYTFFEMLKPNRSYVLLAIKGGQKMSSLMQLKGLRKLFKEFAGELIEESNDTKQFKILKYPKGVFSEGAWIQMLYILKFWLEDTSPSFEKTDLLIEKSVRVIFDVFETTPLESVVDFGKFLYKEQMS